MRPPDLAPSLRQAAAAELPLQALAAGAAAFFLAGLAAFFLAAGFFAQPF